MQNTLFNVNKQSGKKKCIQCDVFFEIEKFAKRGKDKNGNQKYSGSCLVCKRQKDRAWRLNNPDRANSHRIKYVESEKGKKRRKEYSERKKKGEGAI